MNNFTSPNFLEEVIKEMVCDVNKKVRDSILLGKAKLSRSPTFMNSEISEELSLNKHYLGFKIKEFRLSHTVEKKKVLQKNLQRLDQKIEKLKSQIDAKSEFDLKQSFNRNLINYSPITRSRVAKIPKMSDDMERKQKEIEARNFVHKLNKEKKERINEERKKNLNKLILIDDASNSNNVENKAKLYVILPQINKNSPKNVNSSNNDGSNNTLSVEKVNSQSPKEKEVNIEDIKKNEFTFKRNGQNIVSSETSAIKHIRQSTDHLLKVQKVEESLFDNSISFKSNKKSPYYFNDPKYSKLMEIKQKYNLRNNANKQPKGEMYSGDIRYISDQNNISEEDYEILYYNL